MLRTIILSVGSAFGTGWVARLISMIDSGGCRSLIASCQRLECVYSITSKGYQILMSSIFLAAVKDWSLILYWSSAENHTNRAFRLPVPKRNTYLYLWKQGLGYQTYDDEKVVQHKLNLSNNSGGSCQLHWVFKCSRSESLQHPPSSKKFTRTGNRRRSICEMHICVQFFWYSGIKSWKHCKPSIFYDFEASFS